MYYYCEHTYVYLYIYIYVVIHCKEIINVETRDVLHDDYCTDNNQALNRYLTRGRFCIFREFSLLHFSSF